MLLLSRFTWENFCRHHFALDVFLVTYFVKQVIYFLPWRCYVVLHLWKSGFCSNQHSNRKSGPCNFTTQFILLLGKFRLWCALFAARQLAQAAKLAAPRRLYCLQCVQAFTLTGQLLLTAAERNHLILQTWLLPSQEKKVVDGSSSL